MSPALRSSSSSSACSYRTFLEFHGEPSPHYQAPTDDLTYSIFLVALDQTIVATAIPRIASQFNALEQVTWIASAYFLTQSSFILFYGMEGATSSGLDRN